MSFQSLVIPCRRRVITQRRFIYVSLSSMQELQHVFGQSALVVLYALSSTLSTLMNMTIAISRMHDHPIEIVEIIQAAPYSNNSLLQLE